jgi:hypothetical protein
VFVVPQDGRRAVARPDALGELQRDLAVGRVCPQWTPSFCSQWPINS